MACLGPAQSFCYIYITGCCFYKSFAGKLKQDKIKREKKEENIAPDISAFSIFSNNQHHYKIGNFLSQNSEYRIFTIAQRQIIGAGELSVLKGTAIQGRFFWPFDAFFWYRLRAQFFEFMAKMVNQYNICR